MNIGKKPLAIAISTIGAACMLAGIPTASAAVYESEHTFTVNDLLRNLKGRTFGPLNTYGDSGIKNWPRAICGIGVPGSVACPTDGPQPFVDKQGVTLYPVSTQWGFEVVDFLGAVEKKMNLVYEEGYVGDIPGGGVKISNSATDTYKVPAPLGTWCQGLGGNNVKCSTEHYSVLEHVLTCHEVIPYFYADPVDGTQAYLEFPDPEDGFFDCADAALDDNLLIIGGAFAGSRLNDATPWEGEGAAPEGQMRANDNTTIIEDIAASADYSVTLKDDGKPLYRWGTMIKRPNDVRFYARMALPESWKAAEANFTVTRAELHVSHWVTNNPNDQIRPEDLENEAATGRKPSYQVEEDGDWTSLVSCYEGDGDVIDSEEGSSDPTVIGVGTVLKNSDFALDPDAVPGTDRSDNPYAFSSDLTGGFTNAYYTSINRDPFEWSYVNSAEADAGTFDFIGSPVPKDLGLPENAGLELVSGPRWRLLPNKFGQDIPGLEIPLIECSAPPFEKENIKYEVGVPATTVINLLDWDEVNNGPSPLATTRGWIDVTANTFVTVAGEQTSVEPGLEPVPYTTNGTPMTDDFDVMFYIKGDRKPTALYTARLVIETDEPEPPQ